MTLREYQEQAQQTRRAKTLENRVIYPVLGLNGEAGEVAESVKKSMRKDLPWDVEDLKLELGDVLWYVAATADDLGLTLEEIARANIIKLAERDKNK